MFWRHSSRPLGTPDWAGNWVHQLVDAPPAQADAAGKFWAYVLGAGEPGGRLTWQVRCDAFRRAVLRLQLHIAGDIRVLVRCNGHVLHSGTVTPEPGTGVATLTLDLGDHKEGGAECTIELEVHGLDRPVEIRIPAEGPDGPRLDVVPHAGTALSAGLFFSSAWLAIFSILIVAVILSGTISDPRLSALLAVAAPLVGFFGIRDVSKLSLRRMIRRGFGLSQARLGLFGSAGLALTAAALAVATAFVLDISWKKFRYAEGIAPFLDTASTADPTGLRDLLIMEPWRREAQILFEQKAVERRENRDAFRRFVRVITDDQTLRATIAGADGTLPNHLTGAAGTVWDPVRWYASMLPEGDADGEFERMERAMALLAGRQDCGSQLHLQVLRIEHFRGNPDSGKSREENISHLYGLIDELSEMYENRPLDCDTYEHSVQLAQDMLANVASFSDHARATQIWNDLLRVRQETNDADRYWRSPHKLVLYQLFRGISEAQGTYDPNDPKQVFSENIMARKAADGREFRTRFMDEVYDRNPAFGKLVEWQKGTVVDVSAAQIEAMLTKGWRF